MKSGGTAGGDGVIWSGAGITQQNWKYIDSQSHRIYTADTIRNKKAEAKYPGFSIFLTLPPVLLIG